MAPLGNFVRLQPLHTNELPSHEALDSLINGPIGRQASNGSTPTNGAITRPELRRFVTHILNEAWRFAEYDVPQIFASKGTRKSPPSSSEVELLAKSFSQTEMQNVPWLDSSLPRQWSGHGRKPAENWFGRRSHHPDVREEGTATVQEFDFALRHDHPEHEMAYTPDVYDCFEVLHWNNKLQALAAKEGPIQGEAGAYTEVRMSIREMCHKMPTWPLRNRVFPVLVLAAKGPTTDAFIVVQIPVDISNITSAFYSNKRNLTEAQSKQKRKKVIVG